MHQELWPSLVEHGVVDANGRDLNVEHQSRQHHRDHLLTHRAVREANENWVSLHNFTSLIVSYVNFVCGVSVLGLCDIKVVVDHPLSEWDALLLLYSAKLVLNMVTISLVDDLLVRLGAKRQVINLVTEVNLDALSHQGLHHLWTVML